MTNGLRLGVLASGRGSDLQSLLDANAQGRIASRVSVVLSDVASARAVERARGAGIPAEALEPRADLRGPERRDEHEARLLKVLAHHRVDLVVLAGYMRLVSATFVAAYPNRIVNIHPALLPAFPGLHSQKQALDYGVRLAGCTTHFVDEQTDHGPILLQAALPVQPNETEESLSRRILEVEHQILPRTIHLLEQGRVHVEGRRVRLDPDASWTTRYPTLPGVLYGPGY
jgi:phosphoribosylglycinamide formyltransferase 1